MRAAPLCAVLALSLTGCLQIDEVFTIYPDGSGKIHMQFAFRKTMLKFLEEAGKAQGLAPAGGLQAELMNPPKFFENARGITAVRSGTAVDDGEWVRNTVTAYFDDLNAVRLGGGAAAAGGGGFQAVFTPGSLTVSNRLYEFREGFERGAAQRGTTPEQMKASFEFIKPMLEGMRVRFSVNVPGGITGMSGFMTKEGSTASSEVNAEVLIATGGDPDSASTKRLKDLMSIREARVAWTPEGFDPARTAAFREELAAAKAAGGVRPTAGAPAAPEKPRGLADDASQFTDDEVEKLFIDAQLKIARSHLDRGDKAKARETLQGILKDYPKARAAQEAKKLLEGIR